MEQKKLVRELRQEALMRMERGARTEGEYNEVVQMYDKLDANRERKERYHEISCPHETMYRAPAPKEDLLDIIFDSADEFHELIEDADPSNAVQNLSAKQKDVFYLHKVRVYSISQIALVKGQSSRNIRKMRGLILERMQEKLKPRILHRMEKGPPITKAMRWFIEDEQKKEGGA